VDEATRNHLSIHLTFRSTGFQTTISRGCAVIVSILENSTARGLPQVLTQFFLFNYSHSLQQPLYTPTLYPPLFRLHFSFNKLSLCPPLPSHCHGRETTPLERSLLRPFSPATQPILPQPGPRRRVRLPFQFPLKLIGTTKKTHFLDGLKPSKNRKKKTI